MGRTRRSKIITGAEYAFGASASASTSTATTGMVRIVRGATSNTHSDFNGYVSPGDTIKVLLDQSVSMPTKNRYVYFDSPYEGTNGAVTYSIAEGSLPSGMSVSADDDNSDNDWGTFQVYNTPNATGYVKYKVTYNDYYETFDIFYALTVAPAGTTPAWSVKVLPPRIIRNAAGRQTLAPAPTTSYATPIFTLKSVSGFTNGVTPSMDPATGEVYVENVGDITAPATPHSFIVSVDLGEYGVFEQLFSGDMAYGDPYGARYFGPANADRNLTSSQTYASVTTSEVVCTPLKSSGALRRYQVDSDTSPYLLNDGYGCQWVNYMGSYTTPSYQSNLTSAYVKNGYVGMDVSSNNFWSSGSNHQVARFRWTAPPGVTSFCAVAVGGGSMGTYSWAQDGGGGGGLVWMNGITCQPGEEFEICVGLGRQCESSNGSYGAGPSWIRRISTTNCIIFAQGGGWTGYSNSNPNGQSTSYTGGVSISGLSSFNKSSAYNYNDQRDGGGWGVNANEGASVNGFHYGGGSAPYSSDRMGVGAGGYISDSTRRSSSQQGTTGGGANGYSYSSTYGYSAGGGTGLDGQGWGGAAGQSAFPDDNTDAGSGIGGSNGSPTSYSQGSANYYGGGGGGSGGSRGAYGESQWTNSENGGNQTRAGGMHGGGGGGSGTSWGGGHGAPGGVRIIWGMGADGTPRSFPYHYASERPDMKIAGKVDP